MDLKLTFNPISSMKKEKVEKIIEVMTMVMEDMENDAKNFDGQPLTGRTVAEYFGNHGAAIKAVAEAVKEILTDKELTPPISSMKKLKKVENDSLCPICTDSEASPAHNCEDCDRYVCQDCFNFKEQKCLEHQEGGI